MCASMEPEQKYQLLDAAKSEMNIPQKYTI